MELFCRLAANAIAAVHLGVVVFVVVGFLATFWGIFRKKAYVRNFYFRIGLLATISFIAFNDARGVRCFLSSLEDSLRVKANQPGYSGYFVPKLVYGMFSFDLPPWWISTAYAAISLVLAVACIVSPPRWPGRPAADRDDLRDGTMTGLENSRT